jgi:diguanylate cyclase (GGDEF)-like protein
MTPRISVESRIFATFVAAAAALALAAAVLVVAAHAWLDNEARVDIRLRDDRVLSMLSSTIDDAQRTDERALMTNRVRNALAELRSDRAAANRQREAVKGWSVVFAALAVAFVAVSAAALRMMLRERRQLADRLSAELNHDPLTGLPNRRFFTEWLSFAIANARRESEHVGVLFIDINGCAAVAELHGGPAIEALLVEVARRFRAAAREGDVFARLGASEFALATPNASDTRELAILAQRLRDVLNDPAQPPLADTPIGTSIGVAFFPEDADDSAGVMAAANAAMFVARRAGRNHVAFNAIAA